DSLYYGTTPYAVSWLPVNTQYSYLAVGGAYNASASSKVFYFNGKSLSQVTTAGSPTTTVWALDWFGQDLAIGSNINPRVLTAGPACLTCLTNNNTVTNVHGGANSGIGYAISQPNLFTNNTGYNNDTNYYPEQNNQNNNNSGF
ncbi:MAG: hypothetical protein U1E13_03930, partial [Methylophilaceae bacterium]|nr:hypothetical protein [Methylophilaceae bacterium]